MSLAKNNFVGSISSPSIDVAEVEKFSNLSDKWWDEGDVVTIGNEELDVYFCPGHTPGHIIFFNKKSNLAIVGDVLFNGSIGRTDLPGGNYEQLINSVKNKLWPLGDNIYFIPGHGPSSTFKVERESNPFVSDSALG